MKIILTLLVAFALNTKAMAQDPATPAPETTPAAEANKTNDKALVDQNHEPKSVFEGQGGTPKDKSAKKGSKKSKKHSSGKKHGAKKHRKNKKPQA